MLFEMLLFRLSAGLPVSDLVGPDLDAERVIRLMAPISDAGASIESVVGNVQRVDAVVRSGDATWRVVFGSVTAERIEWLAVYERPKRFDGIQHGLAIVVNGPSGAGKSTLMKALQDTATFPIVVLDEPEHVGTVQAGYLIWREQAPTLHRGYLEAIASLARAGNYTTVSAAGHPSSEFVDAFDGVTLVTVGLRCDLDVLVEREQRSGRWAGIAAASVGVHEGWAYDLSFDTTTGPDPLAMAEQVLNLADARIKLRST
jgi:chloramphenicol 3-O-phosphotransferase